jgi:hypothetical protein
LGYIKKTTGTWYKWTSGVPKKTHLTRIKNEFAAMKKPKKIVVKILWGLISYEV